MCICFQSFDDEMSLLFAYCVASDILIYVIFKYMETKMIFKEFY